jgi:hypothetical protein
LAVREALSHDLKEHTIDTGATVVVAGCVTVSDQLSTIAGNALRRKPIDELIVNCVSIADVSID